MLIISLQGLLYGPVNAQDLEELYEVCMMRLTETILATLASSIVIDGKFLFIFTALLASEIWCWIGNNRIRACEHQRLEIRLPSSTKTCLEISISTGKSVELRWIAIYHSHSLAMSRRRRDLRENLGKGWRRRRERLSDPSALIRVRAGL